MVVSSWIDINQRIIEALGLDGRKVISIDIKFRANEVPTAEILLDLGFDEDSSGIMTELCHYELIERDCSE